MSDGGIPGKGISRRDFEKLTFAALGALLAGPKVITYLAEAAEAAGIISAPLPTEVKKWIDYEQGIAKALLIGGIGGIAGGEVGKKIAKATKHKEETGEKVGQVVGALAGGLAACAPKPTTSEPTQDQKTEVANQATALPEATPTIMVLPTSTTAPSDLEPPPIGVTAVPSVFTGLNIGQLDLKNGQPPTTTGTVDGYLTPINTLYSPESPNQTTGFGIDQEYLKKYFAAQTVDGVTVGDYNGTSITLKNGIWKAATNEVFIPFIKNDDARGNVYQVIDSNGQIQEVLEYVDNNVKKVKLNGPARNMFEAPQDAAKRLGYSNAKNVVEVDMSPTGSINFVTKEARPTTEKPDRVVKVVHDTEFLSPPEDLSKNGVFMEAIKLATSGINMTAEELITKGYTIMRFENGPTSSTPTDVVTVSIDDKTTGTPLLISSLNSNGEWGWREWEMSDNSGISVGTMVDPSEVQNSNKYAKLMSDFGAIMPAGSFFEDTLQRVARKELSDYGAGYAASAGKNGQDLYIHPGFFHQDNFSSSIDLASANRDEIQAFVDSRLTHLIEYAKLYKDNGGKRAYVNLLNEFVGFDSNRNMGIMRKDNPLTYMFPDNPVGAVSYIYEKARELSKGQDLIPGTDIMFTYSTSAWSIMDPSEAKYNASLLKQVLERSQLESGAKPALQAVLQLRFTEGRDVDDAGRRKLPPNFGTLLRNAIDTYQSATGEGVGLTEVHLAGGTPEELRSFYESLSAVAAETGVPYIIFEKSISQQPNSENEATTNRSATGLFGKGDKKTALYYFLSGLLFQNN